MQLSCICRIPSVDGAVFMAEFDEKNSTSSQVAEEVQDENGNELSGDTDRSFIAERLDRLKRATLDVVNRRERLPQPLFWSLFHTEVDEIREKRRKERIARCAFLGIDEY